MADYCTKAEVKAQIEKTTATSDTVIDAMITAVSGSIDGCCNRPDGFVALSTATARLYSGSGKGNQRIDECVSVSLVEVKNSPTDSTYASWAATDWLPASGDPVHPNFNKIPYNLLLVDINGDYSYFTSGGSIYRGGFMPDPDARWRVGSPTIRVTAKWGYSVAVPAVVKQACIIEVSRWLKRAQSSWNDAMGSMDLGGVLLYKKEIDPATKFLLTEGRLVRIAIG